MAPTEITEEYQPKRFFELIGETPMVDLSHLSHNPKVKVMAKAEFMNPGLSIKDRIVRHILDQAEASGKLKPGGTIVGASSGNTGAAMAMMAAMRGYKCIVVTNQKCSKEKIDGIMAYGAEVIVGPTGVAADSPDHYQNIADRMCDENPEYFNVDQYDNPHNTEAHYLTTGPEIFRQTNGTVTHFVAAGSTGGTMAGTGKYLKEACNCKIVMADPHGSVFAPYYETGKLIAPKSFKVEGVGKDSIPGAAEEFKSIDQTLLFSDQEAFSTCHMLASKEGLLVGGSAGGNVWAALELSKTAPEGSVITTVLCDSGVKYLSKVYNPEWLKKNNFQPATGKTTYLTQG